jgi:outer membrane biosynthesis protein TonB
MAKKLKKYKVGCDSETYAISMVEMPAIESNFVALAKEEEEKRQVFLESDERHMVYGAALIPDLDIYRNDGEHEYYINFSKESIEKMSQDFMKEYRQHEVTVDHEDVANEVCVVESWLVEDPYKDKANALGINVPQGTWMVGMKVNNIETWERVKEGSLKGFSVESLVSLEEFSKTENNMNIETNEMFWDKLINVLKETFSKKEEVVEEEPQIEEVALEEQPTNEPAPEPVSEPVSEPEPAPVPEPAPEPVVEPVNEPQEAPKVDNHLEELVNSLKEEINALKEVNTGLQEKIKDMSRQPSAAPINTNAKPSAADTYASWRDTMRAML